MKFILILILLGIIGPLWILFTGQTNLQGDYRTANRDSINIAPDPLKSSEAIIQVYSARAFSRNGLFATHNWLAIKPKNATYYTTYQVVGWRLYQGLSPLVITKDLPDRRWFGNTPEIILDIRGERAEELIPEIIDAVQKYPFANQYTLWPGPNSNTFIAYIGRKVPKLALTLPSNALGKDFLSTQQFFAAAPSGTGYQFSLWGIFGFLFAKKEGIEINLLGLTYGIRFMPFAIELPSIGAIPH